MDRSTPSKTAPKTGSGRGESCEGPLTVLRMYWTLPFPVVSIQIIPHAFDEVSGKVAVAAIAGFTVGYLLG